VEGPLGAAFIAGVSKKFAASRVDTNHASSKRAWMSRRSARCRSVASSLPGGFPGEPANSPAGASAVTSATAAKTVAWSKGPRASARVCPPMTSCAATCAVGPVP